MPKKTKIADPATKQVNEAIQYISDHPIFSPLSSRVRIIRQESSPYPETGWAKVTLRGTIYLHPKRRGETSEWIYVLAHCLLHLGLGHFKVKHEKPHYWNAACDVYVARFLQDLKIGTPPADMETRFDLPVRDEQQLYSYFMERGLPPALNFVGTAGPSVGDMEYNDKESYSYHYSGKEPDWEAYLAKGLANAVTRAVSVAGGHLDSITSESASLTAAARAKRWFIDHYPLLGALAAGFKLIEDAQLCQRLQISIAAINVVDQVIYMNPAAGLTDDETLFVMAHELLHAGLQHHERCMGRDHYLWNIACDYVINLWLVEMKIGEYPRVGLMLDPELKGLSAESIYDRMVADIRVYRKLATLRGNGLGDILDNGSPGFRDAREGQRLDDFCRNAMQQGLIYHEEQSRGYLPSGLVEEIRALGQPPIKWDVELARWFDHYFTPLEKKRTYSRVSRRQSSTPDIPRPLWVDSGSAEDGRTFGVILDTSGSMDKKLLAKCLGAIASYSAARDVPMARIVFCDAAPYDAGYMSPDLISDRVKVKGRGGTILQPAIDLLERAEDFPNNGPILIITDGECDRLRVKRDHAYLLPKGKHLPFYPKGPVFRID
ncbi:vWA domain-containing protein [Paenibacillus glycanilyticus]|uniref:vWA domain-containing protein n=1 Tax=Paenibacillus glycanilyticus TaxID=126569 RepID=UPI000FD6F98C|nr:peptidase [Paenibacillus glycanilyticus]